MRQHYELLVEEVHRIQEASKPRLLSLADQRSPAELAHQEWLKVALRLGVLIDSIEPSEKGNLWITAIPLPSNES